MAHFKNVDAWGGMLAIREQIEKAAFGEAEKIMSRWRADKVIGTTAIAKEYGISKKRLLNRLDELDWAMNPKGHYTFALEPVKILAVKLDKEKKEKETLKLFKKKTPWRSPEPESEEAVFMG